MNFYGQSYVEFFSVSLLTTFWSVFKEPNDRVKPFLIDCLNSTCFSGIGMNYGTNRCKLSNDTLTIVSSGSVG